jgi:FkbM family methyltransferase
LIAQTLRKNLNHWNGKDVEIVEAAVSTHTGTATFLSDHADGGKLAEAQSSAKGISVATVDLRKWLNEPVAMLKMDIEGSEVEALQGAVQTLTRCRPVVLFESKNEWRRRGFPEDAPHEILSSLGAVKFDKVGIDEIWGWPE